MRPIPLPTPITPLQVASAAQQMAKGAGPERMAVAFQSVALVSMAIMGTAAAVHLLRELSRDGRGHSR